MMFKVWLPVHIEGFPPDQIFPSEHRQGWGYASIRVEAMTAGDAIMIAIGSITNEGHSLKVKAPILTFPEESK